MMESISVDLFDLEGHGGTVWVQSEADPSLLLFVLFEVDPVDFVVTHLLHLDSVDSSQLLHIGLLMLVVVLCFVHDLLQLIAHLGTH